MTADHVAAENFGRANFSGESIAAGAVQNSRTSNRLPALVAKAKKRRKKKNQLARWLVKDAKAAGCPAFKGGGRVRRDELLACLEKHPARKSRGRVQLARSRKPIGCSGYGASQPKGEMRSVFVP